MKIDHELARKILEDEARQARTITTTGKWVEKVSALGRECEKKHKTMIAMLGTAMLAKATDIRVDVFSLQVGKEKDVTTYSARSLCKEVLAAEANRLGIDLGVTGREPLNNQPFFGKSRVSRDMRVRSDARAGLALLVDILEALQKVRTEKEARAALRAFLQVRHRAPAAIEVIEGAGDNLEQHDLLRLIVDFVRSDSESGRRAQAVAAGLLDTLFGVERVTAYRVHDPSRRFPGDIAILESSSSKRAERVFEIRDKEITEEDLHNMVERSRAAGVTNVAMVAVAEQKQTIDILRAVRWAEARQVRLQVYSGWEELLRECLFWSPIPGPSVGSAYRSIARRLGEMEVSSDGKEYWRSSV